MLPTDSSAPLRWSFLQRALHWISALLVLGCISAVWLVDSFPKTSYTHGLLFRTHMTLGLAAGLFMLVRIVVRLQNHGPRHSLPRHMADAALGVQLFLYTAVVLLPVLGFSAVSSHTHVITLLGGLQLPGLPVPAAAGRILITAHKLLANVLIWVIGLHAAAALFHHFVRKDQVLRSML